MVKLHLLLRGNSKDFQVLKYSLSAFKSHCAKHNFLNFWMLPPGIELASGKLSTSNTSKCIGVYVFVRKSLKLNFALLQA